MTTARASIDFDKIFCIGFHKTGTTSLGRALEMLGYDVQGVFGFNDPDIADKAFHRALRLADRHDAFQDFPWPLFYQEFDERYPGSKFILTIRPSDEWIDSVTKHFGRRTQPMHTWIYGSEAGAPKGNEYVYVERYERHNREVLQYFRNRPDDLLVLRITEGEGWEKLCPFLGHESPNIPFPTVNTTQQRRMKRLRRYARHPVESLRKLIESYVRTYA